MQPPGAQVAEVLKSMHPTAKMCTQGEGCNLNFKHCTGMYMFDVNRRYNPP